MTKLSFVSRMAAIIVAVALVTAAATPLLTLAAQVAA